MIVLNARVILLILLYARVILLILLYARVILQEKKIRAVQFTNCTALCTALYDPSLCQSHFARKKELGRCNLQINSPCLIL